MKREKTSRWHYFKYDVMQFFGVVLELVVPVVLFVVLVLGPFFGLVLWGNHSACQRICEANGDENGWDYWAGCYCKDEFGLYNPKDSRGDRSPGKEGP
jgi:hypothetical protein